MSALRRSLPAALTARPITHRGLHGSGRPENGISAVAAAVTAGYGIEIDLQSSADGVPMVFHDATLDRMTAAQGPVRARPAAELAALALAGTADRIPRLSEVLATVAGRVPLLIELKDQSRSAQGDDGALERGTAEALAGYAGPVAVMSFIPDMVARMAELAPQIPRGLTTDAWDDADAERLPPETRARLRAIADFDRTGASFISHDHRDLARPRVRELKSAGWPVLCWTIRSAEEAAAARRIADQITFEGYLPPLDG
jgi:glycerophosphoryl diester phosphodiesterase